MIPRYHFLIGAIVSIFLWLFIELITPLVALIIFLSSILIDFDHYLYFVIRDKDLSLNKANNWFLEKRKLQENETLVKQKRYRAAILIFHNLESLIILFLLTYINKIFLWILIGFIIHMLTDYLEISTKSFRNTKISLICDIISNRNKKEFNHD